jgi:ATP-binding protein involved in chromosome partitioning
MGVSGLSGQRPIVAVASGKGGVGKSSVAVAIARELVRSGRMAYFACPCCGEKTELHAPAPEERTIWASGVDRLARLPFRPGAVIDAADLAPVLDVVAAHIAAT